MAGVQGAKRTLVLALAIGGVGLAWASTSGLAGPAGSLVQIVAGTAAPALPAAPSLPDGSGPESGTLVTTTSGQFQGSQPDANGILSFKGMPYAAPPVGPLRWRAPQPYQSVPGVSSALTFGKGCLSAPGPDPNPNDAKVPQSEDCLTLNVWTPALAGKANRPVMVWIHGGGFQFGSSASPVWDGSLMAKRDVVVVSLNYRLGVFGFLATPQLDGEAGTSGAYGLQDQLAALRWVQQNVARFGGDPHNVTLFGESAGAHSVGMLMTSAKAHGLFQKAILESGASWDTEHGSISTHAEALDKGQRLLAKFPDQDLRLVPANVIQAAAPWNYMDDPTITAYSPSIDGDVLTDSPMNVFRQGRQMDIPVLGGWNAAEWFPFPARVLPAAPAQTFYDAGAKLFGQRCLPSFTSLYPSSDPSNAEMAAMQLQGDLGIAEQTWEAVFQQGRVNRSYAYQFSYTSPYSPLAIHTSEVPFVFGTLTPQALGPGQTPTAADRKMSDLMLSYWTNFARTGNPNGAGLPSWPVIGSAGAQVMRLDASAGASNNSDLARFDFIAKYRMNGRLPDTWRQLGSPLMPSYQGPACPG